MKLTAITFFHCQPNVTASLQANVNWLRTDRQSRERDLQSCICVLHSTLHNQRLRGLVCTESSRTDSYTPRRPSVLLSFLVSSTLPMSTFFNLPFFFNFLLSCSSTHPFYIKDNAGQSNQSSGPSIAKVRVKNTIILVPEGEREFSWTCTQVHTSSKLRHTWAAMRHSNGLPRTSARLACEKLSCRNLTSTLYKSSHIAGWHLSH